MRMGPQVLVVAFALGIAYPIMLGWSLGAIGLGLIVGAISAAAPAIVWKERWATTYGGWNRGPVKQQVQSIQASARQSLEMTVLWVVVIGLVLAGLWLDTGRSPSVRALLLFTPALMFLAQYQYAKWYRRRLLRRKATGAPNDVKLGDP